MLMAVLHLLELQLQVAVAVVERLEELPQQVAVELVV